MTDVSIVVPCFNEACFIRQAIKALLRQDYSGEFEIIVADNGSTDGTQTIVEKEQSADSRINLVDASDHKGAAHARNIGVEHARGKYVLFADADDETPPGWLTAMLKALEFSDLVGCGFDTETLNESWQSESWQNGQNGDLNHFHPPFLPWSGAGSIGVKRDTHQAVGGFDERLIVLEDADYCWRIQLTGVTMKFVSETTIQYRFPKKYSQMFRQMRLLGQYHALLYKRYRAQGMGTLDSPVRQAILRWKRWFRALRHYRRARSRQAKSALVRDLGWNIGRLYGSIRYGILDL